MRSLAVRSRMLIPLLVVALVCPAPAAPVTGLSQPTDIALTENGLLTGQVLNRQGRPLSDLSVRLYDPHGAVVDATTNERGQFAYRDVKGGVYHLQAGEHVRSARVWPNRVAPPSAQRGVLLIGDDDVLRAQHGPPPKANSALVRAKQVLTNPLAVAGIVATAVAIPVAIANSDDGS